MMSIVFWIIGLSVFFGLIGLIERERKRLQCCANCHYYHYCRCGKDPELIIQPHTSCPGWENDNFKSRPMPKREVV
jgi:hypothetical protein